MAQTPAAIIQDVAFGAPGSPFVDASNASPSPILKAVASNSRDGETDHRLFSIHGFDEYFGDDDGLLVHIADPIFPLTDPRNPAYDWKPRWANKQSLDDHFERHGQQFNSTSKNDYIRRSQRFLQRGLADRNIQVHQHPDTGEIRVWERSTKTLGVYTRDLQTKTYMKADTVGYWGRQADSGKTGASVTDRKERMRFALRWMKIFGGRDP